MPSIKEHGADLVRSFSEGLIKKTEIFAAIGGKQTDNVLQGDDAGFDRHFVKNAEPLPEKAAAGRRETSHFTGKGEVLTGETGPDNVTLGNRRSANMFNRTQVKMIVAMIRSVNGRLFRADVV